MFDHIGFTVKDVEASRKFYLAALAPLGVGVAMELSGHVGFGPRRKAAALAHPGRSARLAAASGVPREKSRRGRRVPRRRAQSRGQR